MCITCNDTGYVQKQREVVLNKNKTCLYDVFVECVCKVKQAELPSQTVLRDLRNSKKRINKYRNSHEWWND